MLCGTLYLLNNAKVPSNKLKFLTSLLLLKQFLQSDIAC